MNHGWLGFPPESEATLENYFGTQGGPERKGTEANPVPIGRSD
jgi:hypothetical protein